MQRELKAADKDFRAFEVLNQGRCERQAYLDVHLSLDLIPAQAGIHGDDVAVDDQLRCCKDLPARGNEESEGAGSALEFEDRWTGGYIFENEWQSFRTRKHRELDLATADHTYERAGRYIVP